MAAADGLDEAQRSKTKPCSTADASAWDARNLAIRPPVPSRQGLQRALYQPQPALAPYRLRPPARQARPAWRWPSGRSLSPGRGHRATRLPGRPQGRGRKAQGPSRFRLQPTALAIALYVLVDESVRQSSAHASHVFGHLECNAGGFQHGGPFHFP